MIFVLLPIQDYSSTAGGTMSSLLDNKYTPPINGDGYQQHHASDFDHDPFQENLKAGKTDDHISEAVRLLDEQIIHPTQTSQEIAHLHSRTVGSPFDNGHTPPLPFDEIIQTYYPELAGVDGLEEILQYMGQYMDHHDAHHLIEHQMYQVESQQYQPQQQLLHHETDQSHASRSSIHDYGVVNAPEHMYASTDGLGLQVPLQRPFSCSNNTQYPNHVRSDHLAQVASNSHHHTNYPTGTYVYHDNGQAFHTIQQHYNTSQANSAAPSPDLTMTGSSANTPATPPTSSHPSRLPTL